MANRGSDALSRCVIEEMYLAPGSSPEFSLPDGVLQRRILEPSSTLEFAVALQSGETLGPLQGSVEFGTLNQPGLRLSIPVRANVIVPDCITLAPDSLDPPHLSLLLAVTHGLPHNLWDA